jgi:hypothetical protein
MEEWLLPRYWPPRTIKPTGTITNLDRSVLNSLRLTTVAVSLIFASVATSFGGQTVAIVDISDDACVEALTQSEHKPIWFNGSTLIVLFDERADVAQELDGCLIGKVDVEPNLRHYPLYLFPSLRLPKTMPADANVLYSNQDIALVTAADEAVYELSVSGSMPFRLLPFAIDFPPTQHRHHGAKPAKTVSDSLIDYMLSMVTEEECTRLVAGMSGAEPVQVDGESHVISDRVWNSQNNELATQFILQEFDSTGIPAVRDTFRMSATLTQNVVATKMGGVHPDSVVIVCGHYDAVPSSPGADDNASGATTAIVAAQVLSGFSFDYTIKFICFNAEEIGLVGSQFYAARAVETGEKIAAVINLDMIGYSYASSPNLNVFADSRSEWLGYRFAAVAHDNTWLLPHVDLSSHVWGASDHYPFATRGYSAIFVHEGSFNPYYHSRYDNIGNMNMEYCTEAVRAAVAAVATIARPIYGPLPPLSLEARDTGSGESVALSWSPSLTNGIAGYRVHYRPAQQQIADYGAATVSIYRGKEGRLSSSRSEARISNEGEITFLGDGTSTEIHGLDEGVRFRFSVAAIDSAGLTGVYSISTRGESRAVPRPPENVNVEDLHTDETLEVTWSPSPELDVVKYRVYYGLGPGVFPDSSVVEVQDTVVVLDSLVNLATYFVTVTAIDADNNESASPEEATGIPTGNPTAPLNISVRSAFQGLDVIWMRSIESDVVGYKVYRSEAPGDSFTLVEMIPSAEDTVYTEDGLTEAARIYFQVAAVDEDGNTGDRTVTASGVPVTLNQGFLVIDDTEQFLIIGYDDHAEDALIDSLFELNACSISQWDVRRDGIPQEENLYGHAAILWRVDHNRGSAYSLADGDSGVLGRYVQAGGHVWVAGWAPARSISQDDQSYPIRFLENGFADQVLGISEASIPLSSPLDFAGAIGGIVPGFSDVWVDSLGRWSIFWDEYGGVPDAEILTLLPGAQTVLTYRSLGALGGFEGKPCGVINSYGDGSTVYFGFPLFFMQTDDLVEVTGQILETFGFSSRRRWEPREKPGGNREVSDADASERLPAGCKVFPSPFYHELRISFDSEAVQPVEVEIFDVAGRLVKRIKALSGPGAEVVSWDGTDERGEEIGAGIYFVRVRSPGIDVTQKVIHLR